MRGSGRHILILTDRDWTHPQGGGTGTNLYGQVARWVAWGHRVTVVAGDYPGAKKVEQLGPLLTIHRMGTRLTVFPRAAWAVRRGLARDADVVLEVINGIAFFTPLWLRKPRVALVHHVHRGMYVEELGRRGAMAAWLLETAPLRFLYRSTPIITISHAAHDDLVAVGVPAEHIHVAYLGVEANQFHRGRRAPEPTLLYLGRLKRYKRLEDVLDVLEAVPDATLDVAGDGDHRSALEHEIARRGLDERVRLHGFVDEERKVELYGRAWVCLTASSAEGWCLTVMEAGACGTPSAALAVGGLPESIVDGQTGVLASRPEELAERVRELVADADLRERMGEAAEARARSFTWERTAEANLAVLDRAADAARASLRDSLARSSTIKAAGLAAASLAANAVALLFTIIFARLLGADGYGSLAALVSAFLILSVPGSAVQVATARETALGRLGGGGRLATTLEAWMRRLVVALVAVTAVSIILREQLASLIGVDEEWAAAMTLTTGCLWLLISIQRGALQGVHAYRPVGLSIILEASGRLAIGLVLVLAGLDVTGAYLGTPLSMVVVTCVLALALRGRVGRPEPRSKPHRLRDLIAGAWAPVAGLTLLAVLQNIDVIMVKHQVGGDAAGSYAAAAVAAKLIIWVAIGVGLYLLPEATRRAAAGVDPRSVLERALVIVGAVALPMLAIFAIAPELLLRLAFGEKYTAAADALIVLGAAMALLAVAYLTVQYMLALGRFTFLYVLGVVAVLEPLLLSTGGKSLVGFAAVVFGLQCVAASAMLALGLRARAALPRAPVSDERSFPAALEAMRGVEGWLTDAQARRLWDGAASLGAPATIVEIGSYRGRSAIVLARAAESGVAVVAIDPHAGNDRGPRRIHGTSAEGEADNAAFLSNLEAAGVAQRVRHVRLPSQGALGEVKGEVDLLYVDGAHRYAPARDDLLRWGARVKAGGTLLVHDGFSSVGVTLALLRACVFSRSLRYLGRDGSLVEYRREPVRGRDGIANVGRQLAQLPWFARNLVVKALIVARLAPAARLLGHRDGPWPY